MTGGEAVVDWPAHDVRLSQHLREQLFADCPRAACQHAESSNCPCEFAPVPALTSESIGELLQAGLTVKKIERSLNRLEQRFAPRHYRQRWEDAETFHGRRFSRDKPEFAPTLGGESSSCSSKKLDGHRNPTEHFRPKQLDEMAGAFKHLTQSRAKDVPE